MEKENKVAETPQEPVKKAQAYKVTCGTFKGRNEALQNAASAKKAGVNVWVTIGKEGYTLLCIENISKTKAVAVKRELEERKVKAEVSEQ